MDGRTATGSRWPSGTYYPFVGKAWEAVAGRTDNLAGGTGEIFLPRIPAGALQPVGAETTTVVTFPPEVLTAQPALAGVQLEVPPNALFADNGTRGGRLGMAPVAPDRLPEPLPPGLNLPLVITLQSDGPMNFDRPVPVRFPNLPDPVTGMTLAPGARTAIWSFNHDLGRWEIAAPARVTADGNLVVSDPGTGIRQPGWNGTAPGTWPTEPGAGGGTDTAGGAPAGGGDDDCDGFQVALDVGLEMAGCAGSVLGIGNWVEAGVDLIRNLDHLVETSDRLVDLGDDPEATFCEQSAALVAQAEATLRLVLDVVAPFASEADPTRLLDVVRDCGLAVGSSVQRVLCLSLCTRGAEDRGCAEFEQWVEAMDGVDGVSKNAEDLVRELPSLAGLSLADAIRRSDAATELALNLVGAVGRAATASLDAYCGVGDTRPSLQAANPRWLDLRQRLADQRAAAMEARRQTEVLIRLVQVSKRLVEGRLDEALAMLSWWMIEQRAWAGAYDRLTTEGLDVRRRVGSSGDFRLPILAPQRAYRLEVYEPVRGAFARMDFVSAEAGLATPVPVPLLASVADRSQHPDTDGDGLPEVLQVAGSVRLAGGGLTTRHLRLDGGQLEGAGTIETTVRNEAGTISPGGDGVGRLSVTAVRVRINSGS